MEPGAEPARVLLWCRPGHEVGGVDVDPVAVEKRADSLSHRDGSADSPADVGARTTHGGPLRWCVSGAETQAGATAGDQVEGSDVAGQQGRLADTRVGDVGPQTERRGHAGSGRQRNKGCEAATPGWSAHRSASKPEVSQRRASCSHERASRGPAWTEKVVTRPESCTAPRSARADPHRSTQRCPRGISGRWSPTCPRGPRKRLRKSAGSAGRCGGAQGRTVASLQQRHRRRRRRRTSWP